MLVVTMDVDGALVFERGKEPHRVFGRPVRHSRVAGAGDTHVATLALGLAAGAAVPDAADLASAAATLVVSKQGTATCGGDELRDQLVSQDKLVEDVASLSRRLEIQRQQGVSVVFTNGCFDILHSGHVALLEQAKSLGDLLVVGLNSDASIKRLKGAQRPINTLVERARVLAGLSCVDFIVPFEDDVPIELIRAIRPSTFAKGGDYTIERLPEAPTVHEYGGQVRLLPFVQERSTTRVIERIRGSAAA
jgi:D-beta-D-heptose 7-phosphate kinase/D-beta-D-heptose 1-phosphate adenosyltransferase